jgi:menaquinone-specific isochorismate synthase
MTVPVSADARAVFLEMAERLREAFASGPGPAAAGDVLRVEVAVDGVDPLDWLWAQRFERRVYWSDREQQFRMAGVGAAAVETNLYAPDPGIVWRRVHAGLSRDLPDMRYYGGVGFSRVITQDAKWHPLGYYYFVLPQFEVVQRKGRTSLACNTHFSTPLETVLDGLDRLQFVDLDREPEMPALLSREDRPGRADWLTMVADVLATLDEESLAKVVLARETLLTFEGELDAVTLLRRLARHTPQAYHFCIQPSRGSGFLGATPERLYRRHGKRIQSEALAGTTGRGSDAAEDRALGTALLASDKERREHRFVLNSVRDALGKLCSSVWVSDEVELVKLRHVQHILRSIEGELSGGESDLDILRALHPTPAVGGYPADLALNAIKELEPFERGWYAGPVGWVGPDSAEFAVAIRSGLVAGNTLSLYSGAGIVPGSEPEAEWEEIESKTRTFLGVLHDTTEEA